MNRIATLALTLLSLVLSATALAQSDGWPRTLALEEGIVTVYQPQIEALDGDTLYYRSALAYRPQADAEPIFGAGWLKAPVTIDDAQGIVHPTRLQLTQVRFPEGTTDIQAEIATALLQQSMAWNLDFSVEELEASLDAAEAESLAAQRIKTAPPKIIYRDRPALLVTIDGDPVLRDIENSSYKAVINTPFPLISDGDDYYLNAAKGAWYRAGSATGPYRFDPNTPKDIVQMVEDAEAQAPTEATSADAVQPEPITAANAPEIVVSTEPAELVVTEGPADFVPLVDDLLVLENSDDDVFLHVGEQKYYIVLSGRWYRANSLEGPWEYQAADALPAAFAQIPEDSAQADSRVYVAGTPEAEEAVLDAQVPQTAAVQRGEVDIDVEYDGDPDFDRVDGTEDLNYARNTGATVLESDRTYYLLEDGVWYVSSSPHGPWVVSDHRPGEVDSIQPSSPVYNTKYVYVYDSTPEVVYVGYTPGYLGSYVYYDTIVYGTGWHYRPWISPRYYYPRFNTWGFHVGYSNWGGWSFGLSWYWPYYSLDYYYGGYWHYGRPWYSRYWGYWGPRGYCYRPYYWGHAGYRHYGYNDYDRGHWKGYGKDYRYHDRHDKYAYGDRYDRNGSWDRDYDRRDRYDRERHRNLYRDDRQRARVTQTRDRWDGDRDRNDFREPDRNEQRFVDNRKVRQSTTGPVRPADLRRKADVRDINRAASREPMVVDKGGEVRRAFDNGGPRDEGEVSLRDDSIAVPGRHRNSGAQRDASDRLAQRKATQRKIDEARTGPVTRDDLRAQAQTRDKMRENRTAPVTRDDQQARAEVRDKERENRATPVTRDEMRDRAQARDNDKVRENRTAPVTRDEMRARASARDAGAAPTPRSEPREEIAIAQRNAQATKNRESRTAPVTRDQLRQRGDFAANRDNETKPSVNRTLPQPSRSIDRSNREVRSQAPDTRNNRRVATPSPRPDVASPRSAAPTSSMARRDQPAGTLPSPRPEARNSRQVTSPSRQVEQRAPQTRPSRQVSAPNRREPAPAQRESRAPVRQMSREPSRPQQRSAPQPQQRSAPRPQQRSAPQPQQRSAPRPQQRSAPQRSAPRQKSERTSPQRERGNAREQHRKN